MPSSKPAPSGDWKRFQAFVPSLLLSPQGHVLHATEAAQALLGWSSRPPASLFAALDASSRVPVLRDLADMAARRRHRARWMIRVRTGRGHWRWFVVAAENRLGDEGGVRLTLRDI